MNGMMMEDLIVEDWFNARAMLKIQSFKVEKITFQIMALSAELIQDFKACTTSEKMIDLAADAGISFNRSRLMDDENLAKDLKTFWAVDMVKAVEPSIKQQVAEKVCEISGVSDELEYMIAEEEEKAEADRVAELKEKGNLDGDKDLPEILIDTLNDDKQAAA